MVLARAESPRRSPSPRRHAGRLWPWVPALLYMALIWVISSMRVERVPIEFFPFADKGIHFLEFAGLGFLVTHGSLRTWTTRSRLRVWAVATFIAAAWGLLDEMHQAFTPGRMADIMDFGADFLGASTGAASRTILSWAVGRDRGAKPPRSTVEQDGSPTGKNG